MPSKSTRSCSVSTSLSICDSKGSRGRLGWMIARRFARPTGRRVMSHEDPYRPNTGRDRGAYTPPTDDDLPFNRQGYDPRRGGGGGGGGGKGPPMTLIMSAIVLVLLIIAVVVY